MSKMRPAFFEAIAILGVLGSTGLLAAGCNAECAGTVEVKVRGDQCYSALVYDTDGAAGSVINEKFCGNQTASVPAGNYRYTVATTDPIGAYLGSGDITVACGETRVIDLDDSNGYPSGAEVKRRGCTGLPPKAETVSESRCISGEAKPIFNYDIYCSSGATDYNQWGLVCL